MPDRWETLDARVTALEALLALPRTDANRLALAVLAGDGQAALALADLVLETYRRESAVPAGLDLEGLGLSRRVAHNLATAGGFDPSITSVEALLSQTHDDLLGRRNFGEIALDQVRKALAKHGLYLRGEKRKGAP